MLFNKKYIIVGAGFFGAIIAERIATQKQEKILIIDKRNHIGGNCYSEVETETGIEVHKYGSHIFHTDNMKVWDYISKFMPLNNYRHHVFTTFQNNVYQMPINLFTINHFYGKNLKPFEVQEFIQKEIEKEGIAAPQNLEEKAISLIGRPLYEAFIKGYTIKQWETDPKRLPADIITRLPFRLDYNSEYFNDPIQGIPVDGYTRVFEKILDHTNIDVQLNTDYFAIKNQVPKDAYVVFTGPIDQFFNYRFGRLGWRTVDFQKEIHDVRDYQGTSVMNYADSSVPFTRIHEFRHFHPERNYSREKTVTFKEFSRFSREGDEPYYPVNTKENLEKLALYKALEVKNVFFGGRLGSYKYYDMDDAIESALVFFEKEILKL